MKKGELLNKMLIIMVNAHADQFDKSGAPYCLHPLAVMNILHSDDEELQCIAVGHDLFEDTKVTKTDLFEAGMTQRIVDGIMNLTKMPGQSMEEYKAGVFSNVDAMMVKKADLKHNSDLGRLKGVTLKDLERAARYQLFYFEIETNLAEIKALA